MADMTADQHPAPDDLQRCADGDLEPARDAALVAHVESCATCRSEIEEMRRVTALLSLSSAPPADLFERVKARRESGGRFLPPLVAPGEEQPAAAMHTPAATVSPAIGRRSWGNRRT